MPRIIPHSLGSTTVPLLLNANRQRYWHVGWSSAWNDLIDDSLYYADFFPPIRLRCFRYHLILFAHRHCA